MVMIMTEKRFNLHIVWYNKEKTDGKATLKDGGQPLGVIESIEDARLIRDILNELYDEKEQLQFKLKECFDNKLFSRRELEKENERIKHIIKEAYETERTAIGKNVLKQLLDNI